MFQKVLVPVDILEPSFSRKAIASVEALIKANDGEMRLIYVSAVITPMVGEFLPPAYDQESQAEAKMKLEAQAQSVTLPKDKVSTVVRLGGIYHEILDEARSFGADLIVVGSHHPTMATYLLGSNAASIVRHAQCSVLVIR
ncbi:MAG: universal stress protein [Hyphomicrobiales bacterium]|nr:universal stress protein [Hyphomicrobiales bacterium]OQW80752.1 MAG: universal stress protein UspA [Proteobacteria bacterium ST_bin15]